MDDFVGKICGCVLKLVIIAVVIAYLTTVIAQPSLFLGWLGIGKWGDAYYDSNDPTLSEEEQAEFDNEIEYFFSTTKQAINAKVKNLLNDYLDLDKRFDKISNEIKRINKSCNINQQNVNIQNEIYNKFIENHNLLIEINSQIQDIDIELFQLKKDIIQEYFDNSSCEDYDYYNSNENSKLCQLFDKCCNKKKKVTIERGNKNGGSSRGGNNSTENVLIVPKELSENIKNLETNLNTIIIEIEKEITNITVITEKAITEENSQCWYILGTKEELEELNIVHVKSIWKWNWSVDLNDEGMFDKRRFFQGDKRNIKKIPIPIDCNGYEILTDMPDESYKEKHDYIEIINQKEFWSNTDFLVILLKKME